MPPQPPQTPCADLLGVLPTLCCETQPDTHHPHGQWEKGAVGTRGCAGIGSHLGRTQLWGQQVQASATQMAPAIWGSLLAMWGSLLATQGWLLAIRGWLHAIQDLLLATQLSFPAPSTVSPFPGHTLAPAPRPAARCRRTHGPISPRPLQPQLEVTSPASSKRPTGINRLRRGTSRPLPASVPPRSGGHRSRGPRPIPRYLLLRASCPAAGCAAPSAARCPSSGAARPAPMLRAPPPPGRSPPAPYLPRRAAPPGAGSRRRRRRSRAGPSRAGPHRTAPHRAPAASARPARPLGARPPRG